MESRHSNIDNLHRLFNKYHGKAEPAENNNNVPAVLEFSDLPPEVINNIFLRSFPPEVIGERTPSSTAITELFGYKTWSPASDEWWHKLIFKYFDDDDIMEALKNAQFRSGLSEAEWQKKITSGYNKFWIIYQEIYAEVEAQYRSLFSLVKDGDMANLSRRNISTTAFDRYDTHHKSLLDHAKIRTNYQEMADYFYKCAEEKYRRLSKKKTDTEANYAVVTDYRNRLLLHWAIVFNQDLKIIMDLRKNQTDEQREGFAPIFMAAIHGRTDVVNLILKNAPEFVNLYDQIQRTPLMFAVLNQHTDTVKSLLEHHADPNIRFDVKKDSKDGTIIKSQVHNCCKTPLYIACETGQTTIAKMLLNAGANYLTSACNNAELLPIHIAVKKGHLDTVKMLITPDDKRMLALTDLIGRTPLVFAVKKGHLALVKFLIEAGADTSIRVTNTQHRDFLKTLLELAAENGHTDVVSYLLSQNITETTGANNRGMWAIHFAISSGSIQTTEALLKHNPNWIEKKDTSGKTPLIMAAEKGDVKLVKYLLRRTPKAANPDSCITDNTSPENGKTALYYAIKSCNIKMVQLLINANVKLNIPDDIHFAAEMGNVEVFDLLYQYNKSQSSINTLGYISVLYQPNNDRETVLGIATRKGHTKLVGYLLIKRKELQEKNKNTLENNNYRSQEKNALELAIQSGKSDIVSLLLKMGVTLEHFTYMYKSSLNTDVKAKITLLGYIDRLEKHRLSNQSFFKETFFKSSRKLAAAQDLKKIVIDGVGIIDASFFKTHKAALKGKTLKRICKDLGLKK